MDIPNTDFLKDSFWQSWRGPAVKMQSLAKKAHKAGSLSAAEKAFTELWESTFNSVFTFAKFRTPDSHTAEDIVHDTYLALWDRLRSGLNATGEQEVAINFPRAFIYKMVRNKIADYYRGMHRNPVTVSLEAIQERYEATGYSEEPFYDSGINEHIDDKKQRADLNKAFAKLSTEQKEILLLRYRYEFELKEIALMLDLSLSTTKSKLYRAVQALESELN